MYVAQFDGATLVHPSSVAYVSIGAAATIQLFILELVRWQDSVGPEVLVR